LLTIYGLLAAVQVSWPEILVPYGIIVAAKAEGMPKNKIPENTRRNPPNNTLLLKIPESAIII
jgi:hypothetical protein